ncbi:carboxylesterase [Abortiporus biennis]|nr:carboxylesterase [Abortiporus biennis]
MSHPRMHLSEELALSLDRVNVETRYGSVRGGKALNGATVFLEIPYALPPGRFEDPVALPPDFRYEDKDYIYESGYATQPTNDGQAAGMPYEDKVGLGKPTENPLFLNIVTPPSSTSSSNHPVKIYIHGGFLQFGSPHGISAQAHYVAVERSEVWINIGYRLSAFGFLASDTLQSGDKLDGNYGFKDQWQALLWIKENVKSFGGDPENIQITGLSAGGHSVHQMLHYASHLPKGENAPFQSAILQSNSMVIAPKTPSELQPQFVALCTSLGLNPNSPIILQSLRDMTQLPHSTLTEVISAASTSPGTLPTQYGTFRGCFDGASSSTSKAWMGEDPMEWQRSGQFARALKEKGVKSIIVGDLSEEWYLYSIAHEPIASYEDIELNLERYYQGDMVKKIMDMYEKVGDGEEEIKRLFGEILSEGQVYLPGRILHRDLVNADFPVLRYEIRWVPEQVRPFGYVTHAGDRSLWAFHLPTLEQTPPGIPVTPSEEQIRIAREWLKTISALRKELESSPVKRGENEYKKILVLKEDKTIGWEVDAKWDNIMRLLQVLPGEE